MSIRDVVSERRWERPANGIEGFFSVVDNASITHCEDRRSYTLFSRLKVDLQPPAAEVEDALRYAWKQVRYEQPQIAVTSEGFKMVYEVPDEAALQLWLDNTFIVSDEIDGEAIGKAKPIERPTLYYVPKASQLIIRVSHAVIDGVSMVLLWHTYLTALNNPEPNLVFGEEAIRLPPSLEKALGHPDVLPAETVARGFHLVGKALKSMPGIGPVNRIGTVPAGPTQRREFEFSEQTTDAIVQACRRNGYSVSAAVHAAYALTVVKHADPTQLTEESNYVSIGNFNLRPHLPEPYNSSQYAAAVYYTIWPLILKRPKNFKDVVRAIDENYKTAFNGNPENIALCGSVTNGLFEIVKTPEFWAAPLSRDALVSSLGIIERYVQQSYAAADNSKRVIVEDFKFGIEVILGQSMFFLYTFHGRLRMVYSFNESYEAESDIQTFLEDMQKILLEELVA